MNFKIKKFKRSRKQKLFKIKKYKLKILMIKITRQLKRYKY